MKESEDPQILWHYTSVDSAMSIVRSRTLHASMIGSMNDAFEDQFPKEFLRASTMAGFRSFNHPVGIVSKEADELRSILDSIGDELSDFSRNIWKDVFQLDSYAKKKEDLEYREFASCFCEETDSLSQWYGYGGGRGVALGFDKSALVELYQSKDIQLKPVNYEDSFKSDLGRKLILEAFQRQITINEVWQEHLLSRGAFMKSSVFKQENEWRAVKTIQIDFENDPQVAENKIKFRAQNGRLIPFVEIKIEGDSRSTIIPALRYIMLGPGNNDQKGWELFLQLHGYQVIQMTDENFGESGVDDPTSGNIQICNSAVPLQ